MSKATVTGSSYQVTQPALTRGQRVQVTVNGTPKKGKITNIVLASPRINVTVLFDDGTSATVSNTLVRAI